MWRIDQGVRLSRAVVLLNGNTNSYGLYSDFGEAMRVTQAAKRDFPKDTLDLFHEAHESSGKASNMG